MSTAILNLYKQEADILSANLLTKKTVNKLSVVVPLYNEESVLNDFFHLLSAELDRLKVSQYEVLLVNDGSKDKTREIAASITKNNNKSRLINFTRNFGKEAALTAGLREAKGDAVLLIDADGQHPPSKISSLLDEYAKGFDMVIGVRTDNMDESGIKKIGNKFYYRLLKLSGIHYLQPRVTDFRILSREVVDVFSQFQERRRITRGLLDWLGFNTSYVEFKSPTRIAGQASYSTKKLAYLAVDSILSNSRKPLVLSLLVGLLMCGLSSLSAVFITIESFVLDDPLGLGFSGASVLLLLAIFLIGMVMISQGIASLYLARIYEEAQDRPLYVIDRSQSSS